MRKFLSYEVPDIIVFKEKLLSYANNLQCCCILDSNEWSGNNYELIAAFGAVNEIIPSENSFEALKDFYGTPSLRNKAANDWLFGYFSYDLKNEVEKFSSENFDGIGFSQMHFFQPAYILIVKERKIEIGFLPDISTEAEVKNIFQEITTQPPTVNCQLPTTEIKPRVSEKEYIRTLNGIKHHIHRGDIYEMNYCMEFFSENAEINPSEVFLKLNESSQSPFSAFYRINHNYLMCASPERFLKKEDGKIISQPMKGTARRGKNSSEDAEMKKELSQNEKEKSENVMIVDLVRNDLSKTCRNVKVDELFGIYTFRQWHQMISTVSGEMRKDIHFVDIIKNAFPMGSMTGAPKVRAMELIEQYETTKRGLYSGAVGYITPDGDFDFNVVIRSILYNASSKYLSFQVGSAITANSIPEMEYKECLLKAKGMFEALKTTEESKKLVHD